MSIIQSNNLYVVYNYSEIILFNFFCINYISQNHYKYYSLDLHMEQPHKKGLFKVADDTLLLGSILPFNSRLQTRHNSQTIMHKSHHLSCLTND